MVNIRNADVIVMWTGIELLKMFQDLRGSIPDFVDQFFLTISAVEFQYYLPVVLMAILLWCFGRKQADLLMFNFGFSNLVGYFIKYIVQQPRPWQLDPTIEPTPDAKKGASGFSLPSGHTTSALSSYGTMAWFCRDNALSIVFIALCILIPFARMYLEVHTPLDIIVAAIVTVAVCLVNCKILKWSYENDRNRVYALIGYAVIALLISIACDIISGKPFCNKMCGFCIAMPICILIKERYIGYEVPETSLKDRVLPAIPGIIAVVVILEGVPYLIPNYGSTAGITVAIIFITLLYTFILKRWLGRNESCSVAESQ
jgi:membrane-associated phospholipid phosphatase